MYNGANQEGDDFSMSGAPTQEVTRILGEVRRGDGALFGYATRLRSRTPGRGPFTMEFDHYAQVPAETAQELMKRCA